jgi:two-component system, OmpR family, response regulator
MHQAGKRILVVEDDPDIGDMLAINLRDEGYRVELVVDGGVALECLKTQCFDLLLLDLNLPSVNGLEICKQMRLQNDYQPIFIVSGKSNETQRVLGLELGADDYIAKPFSIIELIARIRALFRRIEAVQRQGQDKSLPIQTGALNIDPLSRSVQLAGKSISLTLKEFELLWFFVRHPGKVFTRLALLDQVWGYSHDGYEHTVNSHINRLRAKIETDPARPRYIQTIWGVGYRFSVIPGDDDAASP